MKMIKKFLLSFCFFFLFLGQSRAAGMISTSVIRSPQLEVTIDNTYPRILEYKLGTKIFRGSRMPDARILINGKEQKPMITYRETSLSEVAYDVSFPEIGLSFTFSLSVKGSMVEGKIIDIREEKTKLYTVSFPFHQLLSVSGNDKGASYIWCRMIPMVDSPDVFSTLSDAPITDRPLTANYIFLMNGELSAGILSNVIDERERLALQTQEVDGEKVAAMWCPVWTFRETDTETLENPWFKVVLAADENRDGRYDWQDAAILYRAQVARPFRADEVKTIPSSQIGFNASHLAVNPFLRMFDNMKKCALFLDFLPQDLLVKGYQGGGHDSSVPDYAHPNVQAGGFRDLNYMIDKGKEMNLNVGLHINCTEAYPESRYFDPEILSKELGWLWGDQSVLIDKKKDLKSGKLFRRIDEMFDSVPHIDFLYVDTYQDRGWPLVKIREKLESYNQRMYTEFDVAMDGVSTWSHGRVRLKDKISRFIWNDCRDIFRLDPLLLGAEHHGINGWEGEASVPRFVKEVFTRNLPTKFLQHFSLLSWTDEKAVFDNGVTMEKQEDGLVKGIWNRAAFFSGVWNEKGRNFSNIQVFVPWEPLSGKPGRIFAWDESGSRKLWTLPETWKGVTKVYVYQLSDRGRIFMKALLIRGNTVEYSLKKETPYVFYAEKVKETAPSEMKWGEGQEIADPGFNDYTLLAWERTGDKGAAHVVTNRDGQTCLELVAGKEAGVSQCIGALDKNASYYISANVLVNASAIRRTTLRVEALKNGRAISTVSNYLDKTTLNGVAGWLRLRVLFNMPGDADDVRITVEAARTGDDVSVWVDDIRAYRTAFLPQESGCVLSEDFELRDIGWGPFVNTVKGSIFTDLSEFNPGRTADVINGNFSLKTWNQKKGLIYRTTPGLLRLEPQKTYEIAFDYLCDRDDCYEVVVRENDLPDSKELLRIPVTRGKSRVKQVFSTAQSPDAWIGLKKKNDAPVIFVMDDLKILTR